MDLTRWRGLLRRPTQAADASAVPARDASPADVPALFADPGAWTDPGDVFTVHRLVGAGGDPVSAEGGTGRLVNRPVTTREVLREVVLARPRRHRGFGILAAAAEPTLVIGMEADPLRASALTVLVEDADADGGLRLRHPVTGRFVCALPFSTTAAADLVANRAEAGGWEHFRALPPDGETGIRLDHVLASLAPLFRARFDAAVLLDWLRREGTGGQTGCVGLSLMRLLAPDDVATVARAMLAPSPSGVPRLDRCLDDATRTSLAALASWERDRATVARGAIGPEFDHLGENKGDRERGRIEAVLLGRARRTIAPRRDLCVVATARNEGVYLLEWIAHQRAIGADRVFLYSNNNNDGSDALLGALAASDAITWIDNHFAPAVDGQVKAYGHALSHLPQTLDHAWTLIVDLDEFVVFDRVRYGSLPDLLSLRARDGATAVAFSWRVFTPGGAVSWDERPLIARFRHSEPRGNRHVKSACRTDRHVASFPHDPVPLPGEPTRFDGAGGRPHHWRGRALVPSEGEPDYADAWVAHYLVRSAEEFLWKSARNRGGYALEERLSFRPAAMASLAACFDPALSVPDDTSLPMLPALDAELARLRTLPGVAAAEKAVRDRFREAVAGLRRDALAAASSDMLAPPVAAFVQSVFAGR